MFDSASRRWYFALAVEVIASVLAVFISIINPSGDLATGGLLGGLLLVGVAYMLRLWSEDEYDAAETIRRRVVFAEALEYPVGEWQVKEWSRLAGPRIRQRLRVERRPEDYYSTSATVGTGRLAAMTIESAFYTRHIYHRLRLYIIIVIAVAVTTFFLVASISLLRSVPGNIDELVAKILFGAILLTLTIDLLGWYRRLGRLISSLEELERGLESLNSSNASDTLGIIVLVSDYNCQVVSGIPVLHWMFTKMHDEIRAVWEQEKA